MKTFTAVLLVVVLCVERASSLHCYTCDNVKSRDDCHSVRCSDMDTFCVMETRQKHGEPLFITKRCADRCPPQLDTKGGSIDMRVECCKEDHCNTGGAVSVKTSHAVMVLATLASFFYVLRTEL